MLRQHVGRHLNGSGLTPSLLKLEEKVGATVNHQTVDLDLRVASREAKRQVTVLFLGKETLQPAEHKYPPVVHPDGFVDFQVAFRRRGGGDGFGLDWRPRGLGLASHDSLGIFVVLFQGVGVDLTIGLGHCHKLFSMLIRHQACTLWQTTAG